MMIHEGLGVSGVFVSSIYHHQKRRSVLDSEHAQIEAYESKKNSYKWRILRRNNQKKSKKKVPVSSQ
jgi:hypothetical protein